jgi:hypothetical protein
MTRLAAAVLIAYVFPRDAVIDPAAIAAADLTHMNYALALRKRPVRSRGLKIPS